MRVSSFLSCAAVLISCIAATANAAAGDTCSVASPAHRAALVELYTSEGCDSCPPADNWLSRLAHEHPANSVIPLALHVDYWDSSAWKDRFAQPAFTARQQRLALKGDGSLVYTPEVFVDGREMRGGYRGAALESRIRQLDSEAPLVDIRIDAHASTPGSDTFSAAFEARSPLPKDAVAYVAVFEDRLQSDVKGGENSGVTLHHDRVARRWLGPVPIVAGHAHIAGDFATSAMSQGVVAFVENASTGEVLQAAELQGCPG